MGLKKYALDPKEREKECSHELGFAYSGRIPCTRPHICYMCGTREDEVVPVRPPPQRRR